MNIKRVIISLISLTLVVFYVLGIGGINVHTCSHTGERYMTLLIEGISCDEVHPEHHHHHGHCSCEDCCEICSHDCAECGCEDCDCEDGCDDDGCCTNDSIQLFLTGDSDHVSGFEHVTLDCQTVLVPQFPGLARCSFSSVSYVPVDLCLPGVDRLLDYCILRV